MLHSRGRLIEREDVGQPSGALDSSPDSAGAVCYQLAEAAGARPDHKALDIYAAAMEISSIATDHRCAVAGTDGGPRKAVALLASQVAARTGGRRSHGRVVASDAENGAVVPGPARTNAHPAKARSHIDLAKQIQTEWLNIRSEDPQTLEEAKLGLVCRFGEALHTLAGRRHDCPGGLGYAQLYDICLMESSYRIRLAAAQEIGRGGVVAFKEIKSWLTGPGPGDGEAQWAQQVSAWLAPLVVASVDAAGGDHGHQAPYQDAEDYLGQWLGHVRQGGLGGARLAISQEIALAQGFKYAANRCYGHVHSRPAVLGHLQEGALEMLKHARYWFSQLTLIQALCLWEIQGAESTASGQYRNPDAIVNHWLEEIGGEQARGGRGGRSIHPFVEAAAVLASRALETGHPERFLWMDESDLVTWVGSSREVTDSQARRHDQWIQPSMGWSGLDRHAQQLVADVLLLNLAERGEQPGKIELWLERANKDMLPPCIRRDRLALKPDRTVGTAASNPPGSSCLNGCPFDLCPYPPEGSSPTVRN